MVSQISTSLRPAPSSTLALSICEHTCAVPHACHQQVTRTWTCNCAHFDHLASSIFAVASRPINLEHRAAAMAEPMFKRMPTANPPFTIGQLRKAIPAHCFERSLLTSSMYLGADLGMAASLYFLSTLIPSAPAGVTRLWTMQIRTTPCSPRHVGR